MNHWQTTLGAAAWLRREMPDRMQTQELAGVTQ
jgi:hypothetical protein